MTAAEKALASALAKYAPAIEKAFLEAIEDARAAIDVRALVAALEAGDFDGAVRLIETSPARALRLQEAVRAAYIQAGVNIELPAAIAGAFAFDGRNPRAEQWLRDNGARLVQVVTGDADTRAAIRDLLVAGMESNRGARSVALDVTGRISGQTGRREGGVIGLTAEQVTYKLNARADLENLDGRYFTRALRDKRFDGIVKKAIESGKPLGRLDIDRIVGRYADKMLAYRGKVIARNEAFQAQAAAAHEAHLQLVGLAGIREVTKRWQHNLSEEPRPDHLAMNGTVLPVQQPFIFADAAMQHPHDPAGGARHSIGCRCVAIYRVELQ